MAYSNPNIPTIDIEEQDPNTGYVLEGTCSGVPPTTAGYFATGCELEDRGGTGSYVNTGTPAAPVWNNEMTVENGDMDPSLLKVKTVALTAAQINGLYATPVVVIPAVAGKSIILDSFVFDLTGTATQFANGGVVNLQYDSTVNGGGTTLHADIAATVVTGATARVQTVRIPKDLSAIATASITGKGVYISNKSGAFDTGTGTANCIVSYHLI